MKDNKRWYQKPSNWLVLVACFILALVLIVNVYIMFQSKANKDKVPSVFGIKPFIVLSNSMESEIYKGDLIITKNVDPKTLKVDDVIAFRDSENTVTTHRIIDIVDNEGETYFITKGDNNNTQDQNLVGFKDVEGIFVFRIPGIGSIMKKLSEPTTIIILMLGITIVFGMGFAISTKRQSDKERKEFYEYKLMKEKEEKEKLNKNKETKEVKSIKAQDVDDSSTKEKESEKDSE